MDADELLDNISRALPSLDEKYTGQKSPYNLNFYKVLGLSTKELIHSKFIAFLLNPKSAHGCKNTFLNLFIEILREKDKNLPSIFECVNVKTEKKIKDGRFDIFLENSQKQAIIIENKIYAQDQYGQLERYYDHYKDDNKPKPILVYLTLNGKEASKRSLGKLTEKNYSRLSYKDDIIKWLNKCKNFIINKKPDDKKLKFLINEYLVMVEKLTKYEREKEKILPILTTDKDTLNKAFEIWDEVNKPEFKKSTENEYHDVKKKISSFINPLKAYIIREKFCNENNEDTFLNKLCTKIGGNLRWKINENKHIMHKGWGFKLHKDKWKDNHFDIEIVFEFRTDNLQNCVYGLCKYDPINFKKGNWLIEPESLTNGYSNWYRKVFLELMNINTENEESLFYILKNQIEDMIKKIEAP